jgi:hypothetical protein
MEKRKREKRGSVLGRPAQKDRKKLKALFVSDGPAFCGFEFVRVKGGIKVEHAPSFGGGELPVCLCGSDSRAQRKRLGVLYSGGCIKKIGRNGQE